MERSDKINILELLSEEKTITLNLIKDAASLSYEDAFETMRCFMALELVSDAGDGEFLVSGSPANMHAAWSLSRAFCREGKAKELYMFCLRLGKEGFGAVSAVGENGETVKEISKKCGQSVIQEQLDMLVGVGFLRYKKDRYFRENEETEDSSDGFIPRMNNRNRRLNRLFELDLDKQINDIKGFPDIFGEDDNEDKDYIANIITSEPSVEVVKTTVSIKESPLELLQRLCEDESEEIRATMHHNGCDTAFEFMAKGKKVLLAYKCNGKKKEILLQWDQPICTQLPEEAKESLDGNGMLVLILR